MALTDSDIDDIARVEDGRGRFHMQLPPTWGWVTGYADVGPIIELHALWDDTIKKDPHFCGFAADVAQEILGPAFKVSREFGKWGAALVAADNPARSRKTLEEAANKVIRHPAWLGLVMATRVFTYGPK